MEYMKIHLNSEERSVYPKLYIFPNPNELKIAWTTILIGLLKHDRTSWLFSLSSKDENALENLTRRLLDETHRLSDPQLTCKQSLHASLASAALFCLIDSKEELTLSKDFKQLTDSTKLIDSVFGSSFSVFGASTPSGPRWIFEHKDSATLRWMEEFISVWSVCHDRETCRIAFDGAERHWKPHLEQMWKSLLNDNLDRHEDATRKHKFDGNALPRLLLLYSVHHTSTRQLLSLCMEQVSNQQKESINYPFEPCKRLVQALFRLSQTVSFTTAYTILGFAEKSTHIRCAY
jgi:hypothetical protein